MKPMNHQTQTPYETPLKLLNKRLELATVPAMSTWPGQFHCNAESVVGILWESNHDVTM